MSDFYELALLFSIKPNVSQETIDTLYFLMGNTGSDFIPSLNNPELSQSRSIVHPSSITMRVLPAWNTFFRGGHSEFEEYLPGEEDTPNLRSIYQEVLEHHFVI
uniref:hypothetical protein n=1 Tax=Trichocoleus desertorum TaxID=1481672 RepID=UPI0025B2AF0C|nr:hypothetical protein [Trichocoleus desertorum]